MSHKMYIYRVDFKSKEGDNVRFFYARNAKTGKTFCRDSFGKSDSIKLTKIGFMNLDVGSKDAALMDDKEELALILQNFGAGQKFSEREVMKATPDPATECDP